MQNTIPPSPQTTSRTSRSSPYLRPVKADEFLPPVSRWMTLGGAVLIGSLGLGLLLAALLRYNVTVKAPAVVRPDGEVRLVQAGQAGRISSIEVAPNQTVQRGDVLARLDPTELATRKQQLQGNIQQRQVQISQIDAQIRLLQTQIVAESSAIDREVAVAQSEREQNQQVYRQQQATTQADLAAARAALEFARNEQRRYQQLVKSGAVSQLQLEEKQAAVRTAEAQVARAEAALNPSAAPVAIAQDRIAQAAASGRATLATLQREQKTLVQQRAELQTQLLEDQQALKQVETELQSQVIRATSDGVVLRSTLRNPGQVVQAGDTLVEIAPRSGALVVKARVATQNISKIAVGQPAQLRIQACPYPDYGTLAGTVSAVSPDALLPTPTEAAGSSLAQTASQTAPYYEVMIHPDQMALQRGNRSCSLQPGMEANANIIAHQETFLQMALRNVKLLAD